MFSSRTNWHPQPNRLAQLLESLRASGKQIYDLTVSNPTEVGIEYPEKEIRAALSQRESLRYNPDPRGLIGAREEVAAYYTSKGIEVDTADVLLTAGTSEAYSHLFKLLCDVGNEVLVPRPSYPLFEFLTQINDVVPRSYALRYDGEWHIDLSSVQEAITPLTKAIVLVNPHNPTGMFVKRDELNALKDLCRSHQLALIVDEVFADFGFGEDERRVDSTADSSDVLTFTLNGISKSCGLPQMKLGWIVVSGMEESKRDALQRLEIIADTFLSVNMPVQVGLPSVMQCGEMIRKKIRERIMTNRQSLTTLIPHGSPLSLLNCEGGWQAVLKVPNTKSDQEWALELLENTGVYVYPGYYFEFQEQGCLVLSLLARPESFRRGFQAIVNIISG